VETEKELSFLKLAVYEAQASISAPAPAKEFAKVLATAYQSRSPRNGNEFFESG